MFAIDIVWVDARRLDQAAAERDKVWPEASKDGSRRSELWSCEFSNASMLNRK